MKILITALFSCLYTFVRAQTDSIVTAKVDGKTYKAVYNSNGALSIFNSTGKTVLFLKFTNLYFEPFSDLKFEDFDGDGFEDVIINYYSNVPVRQDLILYDKYSKRFVHIKDFPNYPDAIRLKGKNLFYSYHRSGCADNNWDSDLFKIVDFKIVRLGNISGRDCVDPPDKPGIYVSKINGKHLSLIKKYAIEKQGEYKYGKWGLIAWYWKHNYIKFN